MVERKSRFESPVAMQISGNYPSPVTVNGFSCRNCTEVDQAKKGIDPAHPEYGPFGVNDPAKAQKDHFSPEARQADRMEERHRAHTARTQIAGAYDAGDRVTPGSLFRISA